MQCSPRRPLAAAPAARALRTEPGSKASRSLVLPAGYLELGAELALLTCDECPGGRAIDLTDVSLFRPLARVSLGSRVELTLSTDLLAKQPEAWSEPVWQGASLSARLPFFERPRRVSMAAGVQGRMGSLLGRAGQWWQLDSGFAAKAAPHGLMRFELGVSALSTLLAYERGERRALTAFTAHAEAQIGAREAAFWLGSNYAIPVANGVRRARRRRGNVAAHQSVPAARSRTRRSAHIGGLGCVRRVCRHRPRRARQARDDAPHPRRGLRPAPVGRRRSPSPRPEPPLERRSSSVG